MDWKDEIRFVSRNDGGKESAIKAVERAIEKHRALFDTETLYGNLKDYIEDLRVTITDDDTFFTVVLDPKSGEGHDFSFIVNKNNLEVKDMAVGELLPEPEEDDL